jgi:outer membrane protein OmpA-like peptidoglycan-associated protein
MRQRFRMFAVATVLAGLMSMAHAPLPVLAQTAAKPDAAAITQMLTPRRTRGLGVPVADPKSLEVINRLQAVKRTRGLSLRETDELHDATKAMPQTDLEIFFAFNSAQIDPQSIPLLNALGEALKGDALKSSTIVVGGHTDAKGTAAYNQALSDRRAQAIVDYLSTTHQIAPTRVLATGFGTRKLKVPNDPFAAENRRVQIVNASSQ